MHRQYIRRLQPTRCNVSQFIYFCKKLYMFRTVFPHIIRSSKLRIQCQVFVRPVPDAVCAVLGSWWWTEKPSETYRASYRNKQIVELCILLVVLCELIFPCLIKQNLIKFDKTQWKCNLRSTIRNRRNIKISQNL